MIIKISDKISYLDSPRTLLGESPLWHKKYQLIIWIDILKKKIFIYNYKLSKIEYCSVNEKPGFIDKYNDREIFIGLESGIYKYHLFTKKLRLFCKLPKSNFRINDGLYDKKNNKIWFNFYDENKKKLGSLNYYKNKKIVTIEKNLETPNGPVINYKSNNIFFSDTRKKIIYKKKLKYLYKKKKKFFQYSMNKNGSPDGMKLIDNHIWVAFYRGSCIKKINLLGKVEKTIRLPTALITNLTLCDNNEKFLAITTSCRGMNKNELIRDSLAGRLLLYKI